MPFGIGEYKQSDFEILNKKANIIFGELNGLTNDVNVHDKISYLRIMLNKCPFPHGKKKEMKEIDERIFSLINDSLRVDLQNGDLYAFHKHADYIMRTISESRKFGCEKLTEEQRKFEEMFIQSDIDIEKEYDVLADIEKKKEELVKEAASLPADSVARAKIKQQYDFLLPKENATNIRLATITKNYNANVKIINEMYAIEVYKNLPEVKSAAEHKQLVNDGIKQKMAFDKKMAMHDELSGTFDEQMKPNESYLINSNFDSLVNAEISMRDMAAINNATIAETNEDPFEAAVKKIQQ